MRLWGAWRGVASSHPSPPLLIRYALNYIPTIVLGVFVNHFFSGFIAVKLPFSLPASFRYILHSGIQLTELDTCYVSSLSWYFLTLLGTRNMAALVTDWLHSHASVELEAVPQQSPLASAMLLGLPMMGGSGPSEEQIFLGERDNLHVTKWDPKYVAEADKRLLAL